MLLISLLVQQELSLQQEPEWQQHPLREQSLP
jgi:hypothetical protein